MNAAVSGFKDRRHAGRLLAAALERYTNRGDVIALALPRGGVPVGCEVAAARRRLEDYARVLRGDTRHHASGEGL